MELQVPVSRNLANLQLPPINTLAPLRSILKHSPLPKPRHMDSCIELRSLPQIEFRTVAARKASIGSSHCYPKKLKPLNDDVVKSKAMMGRYKESKIKLQLSAKNSHYTRKIERLLSFSLVKKLQKLEKKIDQVSEIGGKEEKRHKGVTFKL